MSHPGQPQPLVRSDTVPFIELAWSNKRSLPNGTTPIPPRNEPLLYIPRPNERPNLLKLLYLLDPTPVLGQTLVVPQSDVLDGGQPSSPSMATASEAGGTELCLVYIHEAEHVFTDNSPFTNTPGQILLSVQAESAQLTEEVRSDIHFPRRLGLTRTRV